MKSGDSELGLGAPPGRRRDIAMPLLLRSRFLVALVVIGVVATLSQFILQNRLEETEKDGEIINVAGRQRMLSQRLVFLTLLHDGAIPEARAPLAVQIHWTLEEWERQQRALRGREAGFGLGGENSETVAGQFTQIAPTHEQMIRLIKDHIDRGLALDRNLLWAAQERFLGDMDAIVYSFEREAARGVRRARWWALGLLGGLLGTLVLFAFFVFRPTMKTLADSIAQLQRYGQELEQLVEVRTSDLQLAVGKLEEANRLLARAALRDELTQIANRRVFDQVLEAEHKRSERTGEPLSVLLVDVDFFKNYNDHLGHPAGDHCLREVATALASCASRPGDLVARYGGEEFALVLPNTPEDGAEQIGREVIESVQRLAIDHPASTVSSVVTISVGRTTWRGDGGASTADLLAATDAALYDAKRDGRNRCAARPSTRLRVPSGAVPSAERLRQG